MLGHQLATARGFLPIPMIVTEPAVGCGGGDINLDFYGLGASRPSFDQAVRYSLDFTAASAQGN